MNDAKTVIDEKINFKISLIWKQSGLRFKILSRKSDLQGVHPCTLVYMNFFLGCTENLEKLKKIF